MDLTELFQIQAGAFGGALAMLLVQVAWQKRSEKPRRLGGLVLIGGLIGAALVQSGVPRMPFGDDALRADDRLFWLLVAAVPVVLVPKRHALVPLALLVPLVISKAFADWTLADGAWVDRIAVPLGFALLVSCGDGIFRARPGKTSAFQLGLWGALISAAIGATGSMTHARWMGGLGLAFGLSILWAWRRWNAGLLDGGSFALWCAAFAWTATEFSYLERVDALLIAAALPLSLVAQVVPAAPRAKAALGWLLLLAPFVAAGVRIWMAWEPDPYAGYY